MPRKGDATRYPAVADIIVAHAEALEIAARTARYHVLHREGIEAAIVRPQQHAHYAEADIVLQAAVLAEGLVHWHCFVDGNKRTAWTALRAFLRTNGKGEVVATTAGAAERMIRLTTREETAHDLARWLRPRLRRH